jgi:hypothetical protein
MTARDIAYDLAFVAGICCLAYAGYQIHPAVAWSVGGLALVGWGLFGAKLSKKGRNK